MPSSNEFRTVGVITQNVLHDVTNTKNGSILPQGLRVKAIAETLKSAPVNPDIVGIQEAYESSIQHNGEILADLMGYGPGFWENHNQKKRDNSKRGRTGEHVGLLGELVQDARRIELGDNRVAVITVVDGTAYVTFHWRAGATVRSAGVRWLNARNLARAIDGYENAVAFGDLNEFDLPLVARGRAVLKSAGLESVFTLIDQPKPSTAPTPPYEFLRGERQFALDDILVRGNITVQAAGIVIPRIEQGPMIKKHSDAVHYPLDHYGVYASLQVPRHD